MRTTFFLSAVLELLRKVHQRTGNIRQTTGTCHFRTPHSRDACIRRVNARPERLGREDFCHCSLPLLVRRLNNERSNNERPG